MNAYKRLYPTLSASQAEDLREIMAQRDALLDALEASELRLTHLAQNSAQVAPELKRVRDAIAAASQA